VWLKSPIIGKRAVAVTDGIHEILEFGTYVLGQTGSETFVQGDGADEILDVADILAAAGIVEAADEFDGDEVFEHDDTDAVDDGGSLDGDAGILGSDGMDANAIEHMFAMGFVPASAGIFQLGGGFPAVGGVEVEVDGGTATAVKVDGNATEDGGVDGITEATRDI
jgi:hypothetical protein